MPGVERCAGEEKVAISGCTSRGKAFGFDFDWQADQGAKTDGGSEGECKSAPVR